MKQILILLLFYIAFSAKTFAQKKTRPTRVEQKADSVLKLMTLDEKILQLNQYTLGLNDNINNIGELIKTIPAEAGSLIYFYTDPAQRNAMQKKAIENTRLHIPIMFAFDVIHGYRTVYPVSLAQGCSWNPALVTKAAAFSAKEAKLSGINWAFAPMIDVARDPRWGRVTEGYGEDPYTTGVFAAATVKGYQGKQLSDSFSIAACLKHFVGYGASEGGRDYHYSEVSAQTLWDTYLPPYKAGVDAGAATLMSSFNDISGVPGSANHYTLTEILKNKWKHDGFVVSDWGAINQLINQGVAADNKEAALKAFMSGVEMDMVDNNYREYLKALVAEKKVPIAKIDDAVKRILRIKFRLGLFDNPYVPVIDEKDRILLPEVKKVAQELAEESMVLLKNKDNLLPIQSSVKKIALIGPMANNQEDLIGSWSGQGVIKAVVPILDGLTDLYKDKASILYAKGCDFDGTDTTGFDDAYKAAQDADIIVLCLGEKQSWSGENASRSTIALPRIQEMLAERLKATGKKIVLVLSNGRPLELVRLEPIADAIVEIWQPGTMGGAAVAQILSGNKNPSGKLSVTFPLITGQIPIYYNMRQGARLTSGGYKDISSDPLYWFGYGLSYTNFAYDSAHLSSNKIKKTGKLIATVKVNNTGKVDGKEAVLWYISQPAASISRPMKELKFFEKKNIVAGDSQTYQFEIIPSRDLSFPDANGKYFLETGKYFLMVGNQKIPFTLVD